MDILKELQPFAKEIEQVGKASGRCIGTGLADDLKLGMERILPHNIGYEFQFNMSGNFKHIFYEKSNPTNFIEL